MRCALALVTIVCAIGLSARAEEAPVGFIKTLGGTATVAHGLIATAAALGMPLYQSDRLATGRDGEVGVPFRGTPRSLAGPTRRREPKPFAFRPAAAVDG